MNKKTHANSRRGRLKRPHAPEPRAGIMAAETAEPAEDAKNLVLMIEELRVAEEELRVQNEELAAARQAVEAERARYHEMFECAPDGYLVTDGAGIIREANRAASAMLNAPRQGLLGKPFVLYVAGVERESFRTYLSQVQSEKAIQEWEVRLKPRGRPPLSVALNVAIAQATPGTVIQLRWLLRDITLRKQVERRQAAQYAVTRVLTEVATLTDASPQLLKVIGEALEWEVVELWTTMDSTRDRIRCVETWHRPSFSATEFIAHSGKLTLAPGAGLPGRVWQSGQPLWITDTVVDPNFPRAAMAAKAGLHGAFGLPILLGDRVLGVITGLSREIRSPDGDLLAMLSNIGSQIGQFIERKQAEEALRESEARLQAILDNSPSLIFLKDTEGRYLLVNQQFEKVFHRTRDEIIGKTDEDIFPTPEARAFRANDLKALQADMPLEFEEVTFHDDGPHTSIVFKFPLRTPDGKTYAIGGVATDISDRKKAEVQLQNSLKLSRALSRRMESVREEERARIARDLHDEIGQALTALKLNLQVVQRDSHDELRSPLKSSAGIIDCLLERVRGISLDLRPSLLDDLGLITTLKWWTEHQVPQRGARIELKADLIKPRLPLDLETACFRIVEEAVNNATKYAQAQRITVILRKQDGTLDLVIRDDGAGFDVSAVLARAARGESMGLLGMEERVKYFGGLFTITSQPGRGTEIRATFPLGTSAETGEKAETSALR